MSEQSLGVNVKLLKPFAIVKETLERIGIVNWEQKRIFPSCYIVEEGSGHKIYHFKELFEKEGKKSDFFDENNDKDKFRRNTIIYNLRNWELLEVDDNDISPILYDKVDVVKFGDKKNFRVCHKYLFKRDLNSQ